VTLAKLDRLLAKAHTVHAMNEAQQARLAVLRDRYSQRGMDVHGFDGDDNMLHVIVYGRITGAEIATHTIAPDGHVDEEAQSDSASPNDAVHADEHPRRQ
jgi:hypothetical protein